jgi:hypothetical protein
MSQPSQWGVPSVGPANPTEMASRMNGALDALLSAHKGATRPLYATAGTTWVDDSAGTTLVLYLFDGTDDIEIGRFDTTNNLFTPAGAVPLTVGPLAGLRNLLINPLGTVNQRGYTSGSATSTANQYTLDRWRVVTSGQNLAWTESAGVRTMTAPAGGVEQVIEGASILSGTYTLNWEGTATATVGGTARTKGEIFTLTGGSNVTVRFTGGTFSKPQLEPGSVVTPFEQRPIGLELALCQRYYEVVSHRQVNVAVSASSESGQIDFKYSVTKRATPTTNVASSSVSGAVTGTGSVANSTSQGASFAFGFSAINTLGSGTFTLTADAEL